MVTTMTKTIYKVVDKKGTNLLHGRDHLDSYQEAIDWAWMKREEFQLIRMYWNLTLTDIPSVWVWTYTFEAIE